MRAFFEAFAVFAVCFNLQITKTAKTAAVGSLY
jgi:hypothetical protein